MVPGADSNRGRGGARAGAGRCGCGRAEPASARGSMETAVMNLRNLLEQLLRQADLLSEGNELRKCGGVGRGSLLGDPRELCKKKK